tara:strand:+ start:7563 stop:9506 length:1944 start_codon:yes stop_codon:yes gene_type:complete
MNDLFYKAIIFILEIKHSFKEKRDSSLINLSTNSVNKFNNYKDKIFNILQNHNLFIAIIAIITLLTIISRLQNFIGPTSSFTIDLTKVFFDKDFENYFAIAPIILLINKISLIIANLTNLNEIIFIQIFILFIAIMSIIASSAILKRSIIYSNKIYYNLILVSFAISLLTPINFTYYNEYNINYYYNLIILPPFISYLLVKKTRLFDNLAIILLSFLLISINPFYLILIIFGEIIKYNKIPINYKNCSIYILAAIYYIIFYHHYNITWEFDNFYTLSLPLIFYFTNYQIIKKDKIIQYFTKISLILALIYVISSSNNHLALFYCISLPAFILIFYHFVKNNFLFIFKLWFLVITIFIFSIYSPTEIHQLSSSLISFWWIGSIAMALKFKNKIANQNKIISLASKFAIPTNLNNALILGIFVLAITISNSKIDITKLIWLANISLSFLLIYNYQKIVKSGNIFEVIIVFTLISSILGFFTSDISKNNEKINQDIINNNLLQNINKYSNNKETTFINFSHNISYPIKNYLNITNKLNLNENKILFSNIWQNKIDYQLLKNLIELISNPNNEIIVIQKYLDRQSSFCNIGFIEFYMRDDNFKKAFLQYKYKNKITIYNNVNNDINIEKGLIKNNLTSNIITTDIEIYSRK